MLGGLAQAEDREAAVVDGDHVARGVALALAARHPAEERREAHVDLGWRLGSVLLEFGLELGLGLGVRREAQGKGMRMLMLTASRRSVVSLVSRSAKPGVLRWRRST